MYKYRINQADVLIYTVKRLNNDYHAQYFINVLHGHGIIIEMTHHKVAYDLYNEVTQCNAKVVLLCGTDAIEKYWYATPDVEVKYSYGVAKKIGNTYYIPCPHPALLSAQTDSQKNMAYAQIYDACKTTLQIIYGTYYDVDFNELPVEYVYGNVGHVKIIECTEGFVAIDTEDDRFGNVYSVQLCWEPNKVAYFEGERMKLLNGLQIKNLALHNAKHDIPRLRSLNVTWDKLYDTMQVAYNLGEPLKGLKHQARKHCAMQLTPYKAVVTDVASGSQVQWLRKLASQDLPVQHPIQCPDGYSLKTKKPTPLKKRLEKFIKEIESGKIDDIQEKWEERFVKKANRPMKLPYPTGTTSTILLDILDNFEPFPNASLEDVAEEKKIHYACQDADATYRLTLYQQQIYATHPNKETNEIDVALVNYVLEMERNGVLIDVPKIKALRDQYIKEAEQKFYEIQHWFWNAGHLEEDVQYFNPSSPKHNDWLVRLLGIETEGSSAKFVKRFRKDHVILQMIADYKALRKILSTYIDVIIENVDKSGIMRGHFNMTVAATGRFSASDPINWQNIASHSKLGQELRTCVIVPDGYTFISIDYSQIEIRVLAKVSGDRTLFDLFQRDADVHANTRDMVYGVTGDDKIDKDNRTKSKKTFFGLSYGQSGKGAAENIRSEGIEMTDQEGDQLVHDITRKIYPGVGRFMDGQEQSLMVNDYVDDMFGRRRELPDVYSPFYSDRQSAKRKSFNTPIQSGAADIIKRAMLYVWQWMVAYNDFDAVRPILMIHDELVFYIRNDVLVYVVDSLKIIMENAVTLQNEHGIIPVRCDVEISRTNWADSKEVNWDEYKLKSKENNNESKN